METTIIRQRLQQFIETAEEEKVKAIYTLLEEQIECNGGYYTNEFKAVLDRRYDDYKNGNNLVAGKEADKQIQRLLSNNQ